MTIKNVSDDEMLQALEKYGSGRRAAKKLGIPKSTFNDRMRIIHGNEFSFKQLKKAVKLKNPRSNKIKRFIFTAAQDSTALFDGFFDNILAYAEYMDAELIVAGFTYGKTLLEGNTKDKALFHKRIEPYMTNRRFDVGDGLVFCGEQNTLPTAVSPLSGFETYTRSKWGIFPHAKVQMLSVATMKAAPVKIIMTTGTITKPNYIMKKAGIKATFHHVYGAVLVELLPDGTFFCRHLLGASDTGSFYDLDRYVDKGKVTTGHVVAAMNWGDIHWEKLNEMVAQTSFGYSRKAQCATPGTKNLLDYLKPQHQLIHDLQDFTPRNHHNIGDPHFRYKTFLSGADSVEDSMKGCTNFLKLTQRVGCSTAVIQSNHDNAFLLWLKTSDYKTDPVNAKFFLKSQLKAYDAVGRGESEEVVFEETIRGFDKNYLSGVTFISEDQSYIICKDNGGIECGLHGHLGANGARGAPRAFTKMGPKANTGHSHSCGIMDGIYTAGISGELDQGYNKGLSSWSHSHVVTYMNGKRAILTMQGHRWHA